MSRLLARRAHQISVPVLWRCGTPEMADQLQKSESKLIEGPRKIIEVELEIIVGRFKVPALSVAAMFGRGRRGECERI